MKITVQLPENAGLQEFDFLLYVASKLYEDGLVTAGQAAEITGLSKRSFIEVLGRYGVSLFSLSTEDLIRDVNNA